MEISADLPSIHWQQEQEHAFDVVAFEPGARVTVPFTPRAGDRWEVDGKPPRGLPPGNATGRQMRDAPQDSVWAVGAPGQSGDAPGHRADGLDATVDQPIGALDATADPASTVGSTGGAEGTGTAATVGAKGLRREVFGFLPYWELSDRSTTLDWRTLSTVAYFSVGCTSGGSLAKRNADGSTTSGWAGWTSSKMTSIIDAAHDHGTRVVLTVTCMAWTSSGANAQATLLGSATRRATLARQIAAAVRDRGADGANLDFEPIAAGYADEFTALVRRVRAELNNVAPGYQLTFDTFATIGNQPIAAATAPGGADAVFVMGYDYRIAGSGSAGSIAPLTGPTYDVTDTIAAYKAKVSPSKVILGVPYYGRAWSTASDALHARTLPQSKYGGSAAPIYADAIQFALANGRRWDSVEQSPWTAYRKQTCTAAYGCVTSWRELYYDDATSLKRRYDLVNREGLRGVGIWALGYEGTRSELRNALAEKFLTDRTPPIAGVSTLPQSQRDETFRVAWTAWDDSTIRGYDVDVSTNGGSWARWLTGTRATGALFAGRDGRTYAFRVRATDSHGNVSAWNAGSTLTALGIPDRIAAGGFATVVVDELRMRSSPSTAASVMTRLHDGDALKVIGGPKVAGGYTWFQVTGPIRQWGPVDRPQVGGWIAAFGNGVTNARPRRPVFATVVNAGITGLLLNGGGERALTPNGDGRQDRLRLQWVNEVAFDSLALRVHRLDGTLVGSVRLGATAAGAHATYWDGRIGGTRVPAGAYVLQLRGLRGSAAYSAPSATPATSGQIARFGVIVGPAAPTSIRQFTSAPTSPTRSGDLTYTLVFGGAVRGLGVGDVVRSGTAKDCRLGAPTGSGARWSIRVTGCGPGTVQLTIRADAVTDAVANLGPASAVRSNVVVIDRAGPVAAQPRVRLRAGVALASASVGATLPALLTWSATDRGGAGVRDFDVRRSVDGGAWADIAIDRTGGSMPVGLMPGHSYRFEVRARDLVGNTGSWTVGPVIRAFLPQSASASIVFGGMWRTVLNDDFSGGSLRYATGAGASARHTFTGRSIAWLGSVGPDRGAVKVYVDGAYVTTIDTHAATAGYRRVLFGRSWGSSGVHTVKLVVVGTAGHPRVDLDAFEVLR